MAGKEGEVPQESDNNNNKDQGEKESPRAQVKMTAETRWSDRGSQPVSEGTRKEQQNMILCSNVRLSTACSRERSARVSLTH